jgi:hypothetical protein
VLLEQESTCSASMDNILGEAVNNLEKAVKGVEELECEHDSLNKEVGFSFHSHCHLNTFFPRVYLYESVFINYHHMSYVCRQNLFKNPSTRIWKLP